MDSEELDKSVEDGSWKLHAYWYLPCFSPVKFSFRLRPY